MCDLVLLHMQKGKNLSRRCVRAAGVMNACVCACVCRCLYVVEKIYLDAIVMRTSWLLHTTSRGCLRVLGFRLDSGLGQGWGWAFSCDS